MESGRFQLLETAAQSIARLLLTAPAPDEERGVAQRVHVTLIKPEALAGSAVPSVSVCRDAEDEVFGWAARPFGGPLRYRKGSSAPRFATSARSARRRTCSTTQGHRSSTLAFAVSTPPLSFTRKRDPR